MTGSLVGSSMAVERRVRRRRLAVAVQVGLLAPLAPDVTLLHGGGGGPGWEPWRVANPGLEGTLGGLGGQARGDRHGRAVVHVLGRPRPPGERPGSPGAGSRGDPVRRTSRRALRACAPVPELRRGHPFLDRAPGRPREATSTQWARQWVLEPPTHDDYLELLGADRLDLFESRSDPESWRTDAESHPVDDDSPPTDSERAAVHATRESSSGSSRATGADAVLAGAGIANLAAWVAVARCTRDGIACRPHRRARDARVHTDAGRPVHLQPAGVPFTRLCLSEAQTVLGMVVGGPGTTVVGCLGAAQVDREGT